MKYKATPANIKIICDCVYAVILKRGASNALMDLIGEKPNPFKGECYVASALVYTIFDGKGLTLYRKKDFENKFHWWIKTNEGVTIDITADQYLIQGQDVPSSSYENAEASKPMWFPSYKKRVAKMMDELALYINENRIQLEC